MSEILKNQTDISFLSKSVNEGFGRVSVAAFISQLDPTIEELTEIKTAVSEAVTNCIVHAYKETVGIIHIRVQIFEGNKVRITVKDTGVGIPDINQAMEPMFTTGLDDRAGIAFTIMQSFTDKLKVRSKVNKGTTVIMEKVIKNVTK
jgi:stage II sporulation protein AB (anti-sigma F factor)